MADKTPEEILTLVSRALVRLSGANGATTDALLALVTPLHEKGIMSREQANEFLAAIKAQHECTVQLNETINELMEAGNA